MVGWQSRGGKAHPVSYVITNREAKLDRARFTVQQLDRYWHFTNRAALLWIPHPTVFSTSYMRDLGARLNANSMDAERCETLLIDTIRAAAKRTGTIGRDCTAVFMPLPTANRIHVRYAPERRERIHIASPSGEHFVEFQPTFTPWVIGPGCLVPPHLGTSNNSVVNMGPLRVELTGPPIVSEPKMSEGGRLLVHAQSYVGTRLR